MKSGIGNVYIESRGGFYLYSGDSFSLVLTDADTYYQLTGLNAGNVKNMTVDGDAGSITIKTPGTYHFSGFANINPSGATDITFLLYKNGSAISPALASELSFQNSQDINSLSAAGNIILDRGDVLTLRVASSAAAKTIYISNLDLSLIWIGSKT